MTEIKFITKWTDKAKSSIQKFPHDFVNNTKTEKYEMPGTPISLGSELFGQFEIVDLKGNLVVQTEDYNFIKYVLYSNRLKPDWIPKPIDEDEIKRAVKEYEAQLDTVMKAMKSDLIKIIPTSDFLRVSNQIFSALNLQRY